MRLSLLQMFGIVAVAGVVISGFFSPNLMYVAGVSFFLRLLVAFGIVLAIAPTPYRSFWLGFVVSVWFFHQFGSEPIIEAMTAIVCPKAEDRLLARFTRSQNRLMQYLRWRLTDPQWSTERLFTILSVC